MNKDESSNSNVSQYDTTSPAQADWNKADSERNGLPPEGFKLRNLDFGAKEKTHTPALQKIGLSSLIGATAFESADLKTNHMEPGVLTGMLNETMRKLENKYHSGVYDAAAMPLIKQYLDEMHNMANIQLERQELIDKRIIDVKFANEAAFKAVRDIRKKREDRIRKDAKFLDDEARLKRYKKQERKKARQDARDHRQMIRDLEKLEKLSADKDRTKVEAQINSVYDELKVIEAIMNKNRQEFISKTELANEELRRAEALKQARMADLSASQAAAQAAEINLTRAKTEIAENELRAKHNAISEDYSEAVHNAQEVYKEQMDHVRSEVDSLRSKLDDFDNKKGVEPDVEENNASNLDEQTAKDNLFTNFFKKWRNYKNKSKKQDKVSNENNDNVNQDAGYQHRDSSDTKEEHNDRSNNDNSTNAKHAHSSSATSNKDTSAKADDKSKHTTNFSSDSNTNDSTDEPKQNKKYKNNTDSSKAKSTASKENKETKKESTSKTKGSTKTNKETSANSDNSATNSDIKGKNNNGDHKSTNDHTEELGKEDKKPKSSK